MSNPFYTYHIYMIWFDWVLWNIHHCRLFNVKSCLYIYIKYIRFGIEPKSTGLLANTLPIIYIYIRLMRQVGRMFGNGPVDLGSIPGRVIPKTQKMVLDTSLLNTLHYKVCIKGKVEQSSKRSSAPPPPKCSSYWKRSLLVAIDYGCQLYSLFTYIYIWFGSVVFF